MTKMYELTEVPPLYGIYHTIVTDVYVLVVTGAKGISGVLAAV